MAYIFESEKFSDDLKNFRKNKNLTQEALATKTGIARPTISMLEKGKTKPTREQLEQLCSFIGQPIDRFFHQSTNQARLLMMGHFTDPADQAELANTLERINIRNRYILMNRR